MRPSSPDGMRHRTKRTASDMPQPCGYTHSIAAFVVYLFFYTSLQTCRLKGKKIFLILSFVISHLTAPLLSVSGLILGLVGALQLLWRFWSSIPRKWFLSALYLTFLDQLLVFNYFCQSHYFSHSFFVLYLFERFFLARNQVHGILRE
jgi:hypothetical protein